MSGVDYEEATRNHAWRLYLGCAMPPIHHQHYDLFPNLDDWIWVDKYIDHPRIIKDDAMVLEQVPSGVVEKIYASHLLEHIAHPEVLGVLKNWHTKLRPGGELTINVPDMRWIAEQVVRFDNGQEIGSEHYYEWEGEHGMQQIIYGSHAHEGEIHKSGFTKNSLSELLARAGFRDIEVERIFEAHDMSCLLARCEK